MYFKRSIFGEIKTYRRYLPMYTFHLLYTLHFIRHAKAFFAFLCHYKAKCSLGNS